MFGSSIESSQLMQALYETLYMVTVSLIIGALIGIPLGISLVVTRKHGIGLMSLFTKFLIQLLIF